MMKNKTIDVDTLLKNAMSSTQTPDPELVQRVKYKLIKEEPVLNKTTIKRSFRTVAAAAMALVLLTGTAFAAWYLLKPSEIADKFGDSALSAAFESESAVNINQTVTSGDYTFTLLAIVSGKDITDHPTLSDGEIRSDRTYAVLAIQKADGSPMPAAQDEAYGRESFIASPLVKGLKPWQVNAWTMNGGHSEFITDGIMYRIVECDGVTMFADRGLYFAAATGSFINNSTFIYNEDTGEISANPDYDGSSVVFDLPLDKSLADPVKAQQYLEDLFGEYEFNTNTPTDSDTLPDSEETGDVSLETIQGDTDTGEIKGNPDNNGSGGVSDLPPANTLPDGEKTGDVAPQATKDGKANTGTKRVMTYDEYKAWTEKKLAEAQAMVDQGKYSKSSLELDRRDYESNLNGIKNGGTLTMIEYEDGSYHVNIAYPVDGYSVEIGDDGGIFISGN